MTRAVLLRGPHAFDVVIFIRLDAKIDLCRGCRLCEISDVDLDVFLGKQEFNR